MSVVYITSDWHFGHKGLLRFRKGFGTLDEHNGLILENYLSTVNKRDIVWFLGDMCFDIPSVNLIGNLPGDKRIVLGNHDIERGVPIEQYCLNFDQVLGSKKYKQSWLTHMPIHPDELRGCWNVHGHVHTSTIPDPRYFNACLENTEYKPIKYQDIVRTMTEANK